MKKYLRYFILILNHTNISTMVTLKVNRIISFLNTQGIPQNLECPVWICGRNRIPRDRDSPWNTETALFAWMSPPLQWQRVHSQKPPWSTYSFRATPAVDIVTLLLRSPGSYGQPTPMRFSLLGGIPWSEKESSRWSFPGVGSPWASSKALDCTKWLDSHVKRLIKIWLLPGSMTTWP